MQADVTVILNARFKVAVHCYILNTLLLCIIGIHERILNITFSQMHIVHGLTHALEVQCCFV